MPDILDEELAQGLRQARKKPRNFVLLAKGTSPEKLLVSKKPIKAGEVQAARAEFKANLVISGIVVGDGSDLIFKVVGAEPTVKIPALREYVSEQTGLKVKPRFEVVAELQEVNETDDEGADSEGDSSDTSSTAPPKSPPISPPTPDTTSTDPLAPLIATMKSLASHIQAAIQKDPSRKDPLLAFVAEFQKQVKEKDAGGAKNTLAALAKALKEGPVATSSGGPTPVKVGPNFWPEWEKAKKSWLDAIDTVNDQLEKLRTELLKIPADEELKRIAEFGLNAITGDHKVPLQKAIIQVDEARNGDPAKAIAEAKEMVVEFRDHIDTDERVEACDDNPFDVKVAIRATLDPALAQMEQVLST